MANHSVFNIVSLQSAINTIREQKIDLERQTKKLSDKIDSISACFSASCEHSRSIEEDSIEFIRDRCIVCHFEISNLKRSIQELELAFETFVRNAKPKSR